MLKATGLIVSILACLLGSFHPADARDGGIRLLARLPADRGGHALGLRSGGSTLTWPGWVPLYSLPAQNTWTMKAIVQPGGVVWVHSWGQEGLPHRLLRSTDDGATWKEALVRPQSFICFAARGDSLAVVGVQGEGLLRTTDAGASWSTVFSYGPMFNGIGFVGTDTVIAHGDPDAQGIMVARSTDAGATWTRLTNLPPELPTDAMSNAVWFPQDTYGRTMWIAIYVYPGPIPRILRTTDAGESWSLLENAMTPHRGVFATVGTLTFVDDSVGYQVSHWNDLDYYEHSIGYLFKTTDGGATWSGPISIDPAMPMDELDVTSAMALRGTDSLMAVGTRIPTALGPLASCSPDGGQSWIPVHPHGPRQLWGVAFGSTTRGFAFGDQGGYRFCPTQPQKFLLSSPYWFWDFDSTLVGQRSDSQAVTLENIGVDEITVSGIDLPSGHFTSSGVPSVPLTLQSGESASFLVAFSPRARGVLEDSLVIVSDDLDYPRRVISLHGTSYAMDVVERLSMYAVSGEGKLHTVDPATGTNVEIGEFVLGAPTTMAVREKTDGLYAWMGGSLYQVGAGSADLVEALRSSISGTVNAIAFDGGDAVYIGLQDGKVCKINVETGAETLIGTATGYMITGLAHDPADDVLWAAARKFPFGGLDFILTISTEDATPTIVGNTGDNVVTNSLTFDGAGNLYGLKQKAGTDYLVQFDKATGALVDSVDLGTLGFEAITMWYDLVTEIEERNMVPVGFQLAQNYPNPFNPSTVIEFTLPHAGYVSLKVYNLFGEESATLVAGEQAVGTFKATWDASGLPSGVYFYRLTAGAYVQTKKMVLIR